MPDTNVVVVPEDNNVVVIPQDTAAVVVAQGPAGPTGVPGLVWRGDYSFTRSYTKNDVVFFRGSAYVATAVPVVGVSPPLHPTDLPIAPWELVSRGDQVEIIVSPTAPSNPVYGDIWVEPLNP